MNLAKSITAALIATAGMSATMVGAAPISGLGAPVSNAALAGGTVIDFDSTVAGDYASLTIGNATFVGVGAPLTVGPDFNGQFNTTGGQSLLTGFDLNPDQFRITFATAVSAFGFNWGASDNVWRMEAFDAGNSLIETVFISPVFGSNSGEYFGIQAAGIASILLTDTGGVGGVGDYVFMDRFTYVAGETTQVPEPGTAALLGVALLAVGALRRRRG